MTIRVVVADDQALVRGGFTMLFSGEPDFEVVGDNADGHVRKLFDLDGVLVVFTIVAQEGTFADVQGHGHRATSLRAKNTFFHLHENLPFGEWSGGLREEDHRSCP